MVEGLLFTGAGAAKKIGAGKKKKSTLFTDQKTVLVGKHSTEGSHQPYQQTSFGSTYIIMWIRIQVRIKLIALHLHLC